MVDTAHLYKPVVILSIILFPLNFIAVPSFPPTIVVMGAYGMLLYNIKDDGRYVKWAIPLIIADALIFFFMVRSAISLFPIVVTPLILLGILMILMQLAVQRENFYFNRTVQSMNDDDRRKARKALKSQDPDDFAEVAKYTDWKYVS